MQNSAPGCLKHFVSSKTPSNSALRWGAIEKARVESVWGECVGKVCGASGAPAGSPRRRGSAFRRGCPGAATDERSQRMNTIPSLTSEVGHRSLLTMAPAADGCGLRRSPLGSTAPPSRK